MLTDTSRGLALLLAGAIGGLAAQSMGIPAGMIVGALLASGLYRLLADGDSGPWRGRFGQVGRLLLGTVVGSAYGPDVLEPLKSAVLPMLIITVIIIGAGLGLGWVLTRLTRLNLVTALVSVVPGGLPAMVGMAEDMGADATVVAAIHFARLTTILIAVPALVPLLAPGGETIAAVAVAEQIGIWPTTLTLATGLLGGLLMLRLGVPAGDMIGSILAVGGANLLGAGFGPLDMGFRLVAMWLIGTAVGGQISRQSLQQLKQAALPAAMVIVIMITVGLLLGWGLSLATPLDLPTCLLSCVPGGASTMPAVAHDLGGDMRLVAALHLTRQLIVFILLPGALGFFLRSTRQTRIIKHKPASRKKCRL